MTKTQLHHLNLKLYCIYVLVFVFPSVFSQCALCSRWKGRGFLSIICSFDSIWQPPATSSAADNSIKPVSINSNADNTIKPPAKIIPSNQCLSIQLQINPSNVMNNVHSSLCNHATLTLATCNNSRNLEMCTYAMYVSAQICTYTKYKYALPKNTLIADRNKEYISKLLTPSIQVKRTLLNIQKF